MSIVSKLINPLHFTLNPQNSCPKFPFSSYKPLTVQCAKRTKRTGKQRYPSEKRKLKLKTADPLSVETKLDGFWRLSKLQVSVSDDPGKDFLGLSDALLQEIAKVASMLPPEAFSVIRKSFDARKMQKEPTFVYTVEMDVSKLLKLEPRTWDFIAELEPRTGLIDHMPYEKVSGDLIGIINDSRKTTEATASAEGANHSSPGGSHKVPIVGKPKVAVVGSGPSGLFAALVLAEFGADVTILERGQAVEQRGRDIGALIVRRILQLDSNFCFGEVLGVMEN